MAERGGVTGVPISPYQIQVTYGSLRSSGEGSAWFGAGVPMAPAAPREVTGRQFDYPAAVNISTQPRTYEPVGFSALRQLADGYDLLRLVIETRKDQLARMKWSVRPRSGVESQTDRKANEIAQFLQRPDGIHIWADWLRMLLEDLFVLDAPALYKQRNRRGDLLALLPVDGATVKPVIDDWGRTPQPFLQGGRIFYPVAFQQILKGIPAVDYSVRDLAYRPRNVRSNRIYGFGPVEQVMTTVNIALRRQVSTLEYYTSGNVPDALIGVPETWTPGQISDFQSYWDLNFEGDLGRRRKAKFVPNGTKITQTREPDLKGDFDEWLARVVCFAFSLSPQALVRVMNRASGETQKEMAEEEGLVPTMSWVKSLIDEIIRDDFEAEGLEFVWNEDDSVDEGSRAEIIQGYVSKAIMTPNEGRERLGLEKDPDPAADRLMVITSVGYVPLDANTIEGKKASADAFGAPNTSDMNTSGGASELVSAEPQGT